MYKIRIIIFFVITSLHTSFGQKSVIGDYLPVAIGINYERITDIYDKGDIFYEGGVKTNYSMTRDRLAVDALFEITRRLKTETSLGISVYNSDLNMGKSMNPLTVSVGINTTNLVVSQKIMFDLLYLPGLELRENIYLSRSKYLQFTLSPYIELEYEQFLTKQKHFKGATDLLSSESTFFINENDLPNVSAEIKTPVGILSAIGGLSLEALLFSKIGISYDFGYFHSLLGRSHINARYRYEGNEIHSLNFKSENGGFMIKGRLRYYF